MLKTARRASVAGTVLLLTLLMLVLLTFEVAVVSLVAQRGLGEEGMLHTQNLAARRAGELVLNRLEDKLYQYLQANDATTVDAAFAYGGGSAIADTDLQIYNPSTSGTDTTDTKITAWVEARRGNWYHLVGRARQGTVDLLVHRWVMLNPCKTAGSLTTILTGVRYPGLASGYGDPGWLGGILVDSNGRAFWGQNATSAQAGNGSYWTWQEDTGLSTIIRNLDRPGYSANDNVMHGMDSTGRVMFGAMGEYRVWTWRADTGLSTVVTNAPGMEFTVSPDDRFYFGCTYNSGFWAYKPADGLSTIQSPPGGDAWRPVSTPTNNMILFRDPGSSSRGLYAWTWTGGGSGLSSILIPDGYADPAQPGAYINSNSLHLGSGTNSTGTDGWLSENWNDATGSVFRWNKTDGISLIINEGCYECGGYDYLPDNTVMFGGWSSYYLWNKSAGLSNINNVALNSGGDLDFTLARGLLVGYHEIYWWDYAADPVDPTSLLSSSVDLGGGSSVWDRKTDRAFFGSAHTSNSRFYTWKSSTGLSTIVGNTSGKNNAGFYSAVVDQKQPEMVYFGDDKSSGSLNVWSVKYGLSTVVSGRPYPGVSAMVASPTGGVFFGENSATGNFYYYKPPPSCEDRGF